MTKKTIIIGKVWYSKTKDSKKADYKIMGDKNSPAGTLKEWKKWAKGKIKLKVSKQKWQ